MVTEIRVTEKNWLLLFSAIGSSDKGPPFNSTILLLQISKPALSPSWMLHHLLKPQHRWATRCLFVPGVGVGISESEHEQHRGTHWGDREGPVKNAEGPMSQKLKWESSKKDGVSGQNNRRKPKTNPKHNS